MNFAIKVALSFILIVQFSFGETKLVYQNESFKDMIAYLNTQPTIDDSAKTISLGKLDPSMLRLMRRMMKERAMSKTARTASIQLQGNKLTIEGLKHPVLIGNTTQIELSYNGEKIALSKPKDFEQTVKDLESFFSKRTGAIETSRYSIPSFFFQKIIIGESAEAGGFLIIWLIAFVVVAAGLGALMKSFIKKDETWKNEWPFEAESFGKDIDFKCRDGKLVVANGKEQITFSYDPRAISNGRKDASGRDTSIFPAYNISYYKQGGKPPSGGLLYGLDNNKFEKADGRFADPYYTDARKNALAEMATVILGEGGENKDKICSGNEFANNAAATFKELAKHYTSQSKEENKNLPASMKKLTK
jgi:hypothetical protein